MQPPQQREQIFAKGARDATVGQFHDADVMVADETTTTEEGPSGDK